MREERREANLFKASGTTNMFVSLPLISTCITSLLFLQSFSQPYDPKSTGCASVSLRLDSKYLGSRNALQERSDRASTSASLPLSCIRLIGFGILNPPQTQSSVRALTALYSYLYASAIGSVSRFFHFLFIEYSHFVVLQLRAEGSNHQEISWVQKLTRDVASGPTNPA